jgi:hypothetical protein
VYKGRPHSNVVQGYGRAPGAGRIAAGYRNAYPTRDGWRAMQLDLVTPAKPAVFDELRGVVLQDWLDAKMAEQRTAAVRVLAKKYTVKVEDTTAKPAAAAKEEDND